MSLDSTRYLRPDRADLTTIVAETRKEAPQLSTSVLLRLGQHFEAALRNRSAGRHNLRSVVTEAIEEALAQGGDAHTAVALVERFLASHPSLYRLDRISFIDGTRRSDRLFEEMRTWVADESRPTSP
jgi:hypothetical protein